MSGTKAGAAKNRKAMLAKYGGEDGYHEYLRTLGARGGSKSRGGGFTARPDLAKKARAGKAYSEVMREDRILSTKPTGLTIKKKSLVTRLFKK